MAELTGATRGVVAVLASTEACDALPPPRGTTSCRVSPVEVMVIGPVDLDPIRRDVLAVDPDAVVEDVSDGWAAFTLEGPDVRRALAPLSELDMPEHGFVQGEVARVAVKVVAEPERLLLLVAATLAEHLERRIREDCAEVLG